MTENIINPREFIESKLKDKKDDSVTYIKYQRIEARPARVGEYIETVLSDGTKETTNVAHEGDFIVNNVGSTEKWIIDGKTFAKKYEQCENGIYKPKGQPMRAFQLDHDVTLTAPWGEVQNIKAGGWILQDTTNPDDVYGIGKDEFAATYRQEKPNYKLNNSNTSTTMAETNIPAGFDLDAIGGEDMPDFTSENTKPQQAPAQASAPQQGQYVYTPKDDVIKKLNEMPKKAIKDKFGIDIDELIKSTKEYGVLEKLAYGSFTQKPIPIRIKVDGSKAIDTFATVKLTAFTKKNDKGVTENVMYADFHKVGIKYVYDKEGKIVLNEDGKPKCAFDRNPLKQGDIIKWEGRMLSPEDMEHLRLTGHLGRVMNGHDFSGRPTHVLLSVDPYNNHELISVSQDTVFKRLSAEKEFKIWMYNESRERVSKTYPLRQKDIERLMDGDGVWLGSKEEGNVYVQYDAAQSKLVRADNYDYVKKQELAEKEKAAIKENINKKVEQEIVPGNHL